MRGKLRDKRATKKETYSRESIERRRPYKRDSRALDIGQEDADEFELTLELDEDELADEENELQLQQKK